MSKQSGGSRKKEKLSSWYWTPPPSGTRARTFRKREVNRVERRSEGRDIEQEHVGDGDRYAVVRAFLIELNDHNVMLIQRGRVTAPIEVPRSMIGNEHELETLILVDDDVNLLVQRPYATTRNLQLGG